MKDKHGVGHCEKVWHTDIGYLHDSEDDTPYLVDGVYYCGRCHVVIDEAALEKAGESKL